ncbi:MAG: pseudouridine synthase [Planctomycetota bacterium]
MVGRPENDLKDKSRGERLQKVLAAAGVASRRECEAMIAEGRVAVNGEVIMDLPAWVDPEKDKIAIDDRPIRGQGRGRRRGTMQRLVYVMVNKPRRVISTAEDPDGRQTVLDLVPGAVKERLYPVGRLDADSTGLILLTNHGELANRLTHPRYEVSKAYRVSVRGRLEADDIVRLRDGLVLTDKRTLGRDGRSTRGKVGVKRAAVEAVRVLRRDRDSNGEDRTVLMVTLAEGQNREVRRLMARLGLKVRKLHRTAIGPLRLKGLAIGGSRALTVAEKRELLKAAGLARR